MMTHNVTCQTVSTESSSTVTDPGEIDFDLWAKEVRRQMMACIKKREQGSGSMFSVRRVRSPQ